MTTSDVNNKPLVQQLVERTGQLYSLPAVAMEVLRLTGEPRVDTRALKQCIERDPALTARILRVVNSSLFGLSQPVGDLNQALALLGTRPLKMLVLGFSLPKDLFTGLEADLLARYWRHTLVKAVAARELTERLWSKPGDEAFTAGLVQDIGQLAMIQDLGEPYRMFLHHVQVRGGSVIDRELEALGFDHCVLSARLLSHWGLPADLCAAIAVPPQEEQILALSPVEQFLPKVLHMAELFAQLVEQPFSSALQELLSVGEGYGQLDFDKVKQIIGVLQKKVEELAELLVLTLPKQEDYVGVLLAAHARLSDMTMVSAAEFSGPTTEEDLLAAATQLREEVQQLTARPQRVERRQSHKSKQSSPPANRAVVRTDAKSNGATAPSPPHVSEERSLPTRVGAAISRCRQARQPLSVALAEIDRYQNLLLQISPAGASEVMHRLTAAVQQWSGRNTLVAEVADGVLALIWENCPRTEATSTSREMLRQIKRWSIPLLAREQIELSLSIGLATLNLPAKNYPPEQLVAAAERCLSGAQLSGGNTVKSIEY